MNVLTTSKVAQQCGVSQRTVIRWIERGELDAYKLPGRGDHRILASELDRFLEAYGMPPLQPLQEQPCRVLIIEDEPVTAHMIEHALTGAGYETLVARDGFVAGAKLHTFKPSIITLDLLMPGIDGLEVLRLLRQAPPPFPLKVLIVSGDASERLTAALGLGAQGVVRKPFSKAELLDAVERLFGE
jgi:excisionase family DNA binding protein